MTITLQDINANINRVDKKVDELHKEVMRDNLIINAHPVIFIVLLVTFFVTMDFWTFAVHETVRHFHPTGTLGYTDYILLAVLLLFIILAIGHRTGIKIRMLNEPVIEN
jgi:hypothetical protein